MAQNDSVKTTESLTGPIRHMSPESLLKCQYSVKSDAWSFGVVINEILTRGTPYPDYPITQVASLVSNGSMKPELSPELVKKWPDLQHLIEWCTEYDPNMRPTFNEIQQFLDQKFPQ